ncbi:50S ribosomal protein L10 [Patescibacteria group bacterium]|nr:50S ribosomal protein L10 [Patescibacteria group bacterium]
MPNQKNLDAVRELRKKIQEAKSVIFADYLGLKSNEMNDLRRNIKDEDAELSITKNTLLKIALTEEGYDMKDAKTDLEGPTTVVFSYKDPLSPIKKLFEFAKNLELPKVKSAFIDKIYNDTVKIKILSELPSKEVLLSRILGGMKSPLSGFANVLGGVQRNFAYAIKAIANKKEVSE